MSDTNTITCPHCKADFPLGEAVSKNLRSELSAEFDRERQRLNAALAERETRKMAARPDYRTSARTLRKLATGTMALRCG